MADAFDSLGTEQTPQGQAQPQAPAPTAQQAAPQGAAVKAPTGDAFDTLGQEDKAQGQDNKPAPAAEPTRGVWGATKELGQGLYNLPGQVIHAVMDKPSNPEEAEMYNKMTAEHGDNADPRAIVGSHVALAYKRLVTDGIVESYQKARKLEALAEKEQDPKRKKALLDAAGVYGGDTKSDSFRERALSMLLHPGAGAGMIPIIGPMAAKMAETGEYGDLEAQSRIQEELKAGKITPEEAARQQKVYAADPAKAMTSGMEMAALPGATEEAKGLIKGAAGAVSDAATRSMRPTTETVPSPAGEHTIPVRSQAPMAKVAEATMTDAAKKPLENFEQQQTQPAVKQAVADVAQHAGGIDKIADTTSAEDPLGFRQHRDAIQARSKPTFQAIDNASDGAFSQAQKMADRARKSMDYAGREKYDEAIAKQESIFDSIKSMKGYGETPELSDDALNTAKADWKQSVGMDELDNRFNNPSVMKPAPAGSYEKGTPNPQRIDADGFSKAILKSVKEGEFEKAGFTPEHIQALDDLSRVLKNNEVKFNAITSLLKSTIGGAVGAGVGSLVGGGIPGAVVGAGAEHALGKVLSKIMTTPEAVTAVSQGLKAGMSASGIADVLKALWKEQSGEAEIPGTGTMGNVGKKEPGIGSAIAGSLDDAAAASAAARKAGNKQEYKFNPNSAETNQGHSVITRDAEGNKIAELGAQETGNIKNRSVTVRTNMVYDKANRGQGIGKSQVQKLIDEVSKDPTIKTVKSDISTTAGARGVWDSLMKEHPDAITKEMKGKGKDAKPVYTADLDKMREDAHPTPAPETPATPGAPEALPVPKTADNAAKEIGTRRPSTVNSDDANHPELQANMSAIHEAETQKPGYIKRLVESLHGYENSGFKLTPEEVAADPHAALEKVVNHLSNNLEWLHNQIPENIRNISKQWYDSAHVMTKKMADKYGISHEKMAAVTAALSPKNGWDNNVGQAERLVDGFTNGRTHEWSPEMDTKLTSILANPKLKPEFRAALKSIRDQKFDQLTAKSPEALLAKKGLWLRILDEAHNSKQTPVYAPDGSIRGHQTLSWGMPDPVAKAIAILEGDGSVVHINSMMGEGNKIRNFYNNIINPDSPRGHVTIDTHAVNADMLKPMGSNDPEVLHNFGGAPGHAGTGLSGSYAVHAEAYQRAAARLGLKPRELQSITWEGVKSLMGDEKKTAKLKTAVKEIWKQHEEGTMTIDEARNKIVEASGGFSRPPWLTGK